MAFCAEESCGKCTPCRIGSTRGVEVIDRLLAAQDPSGRDEQVIILKDLCDTLQYGSLCALGGMVSFPVASALKHFPADFGLLPSEAEQ
jgi:formate dehydrogenase iron-sulfur subunit